MQYLTSFVGRKYFMYDRANSAWAAFWDYPELISENSRRYLGQNEAKISGVENTPFMQYKPYGLTGLMIKIKYCCS